MSANVQGRQWQAAQFWLPNSVWLSSLPGNLCWASNIDTPYSGNVAVAPVGLLRDPLNKWKRSKLPDTVPYGLEVESGSGCCVIPFCCLHHLPSHPLSPVLDTCPKISPGGFQRFDPVEVNPMKPLQVTKKFFYCTWKVSGWDQLERWLGSTYATQIAIQSHSPYSVINGHSSRVGGTGAS